MARLGQTRARRPARGAGSPRDARPEAPAARALNDAVVAHLRAWDPWRRAEHALLYLPVAGEIDLEALTRDPGRTLYVTRTWPAADRPLSVHAYEPTALERHQYGFAQPTAAAAEIDPSILDMALVPGLAFDAAGTRLGYGRGYFDRLLAQLPEAVVRVGVAPLAAVVPRLPVDAHDVPMDYLATEAGIRAVVRRGPAER
jgi:5-formyltetrahydrofolate cyclo-ligase